MDTLITVLRVLADGARGPAVHDLITALESELATNAAAAAAPAEGKRL